MEVLLGARHAAERILRVWGGAEVGTVGWAKAAFKVRGGGGPPGPCGRGSAGGVPALGMRAWDLAAVRCVGPTVGLESARHTRRRVRGTG